MGDVSSDGGTSGRSPHQDSEAFRASVPDSVRRYWQRMRCPEATQHGPLDGAGRCPWCRRKVDAARPAPDHGWSVETELTRAYGEFYDPDHGTRTYDEIRQRYQMGQDS